MATTLGTYWLTQLPAPTGKSGADVIVFSQTVTPGATNDIYKLTQIGSKGITLYDAFVQTAALDAHATPTLVFSLQVTDGTTTKTLIDTSTKAQAGGIIRPTKAAATENAIGFTTDNKNYWFQLKWTTGVATAAAGVVVVGITYSGYYVAGAVTE